MTNKQDQEFTKFLQELSQMSDSEAKEAQVNMMRAIIEKELRKAFKTQAEKNKKKNSWKFKIQNSKFKNQKSKFKNQNSKLEI